MFYSSLILRNVLILILLLSYFCHIGEGSILQKVIYNEKHRYTRHVNATANSPGTVFDNTSEASLKAKNTIVNIEGNADDNDYIPLHVISADNDKETLYRENTFLKQKIGQHNQQLQNEAENIGRSVNYKEPVLENNPALDHHAPIDINQDAASTLLNNQPNVVIRGSVNYKQPALENNPVLDHHAPIDINQDAASTLLNDQPNVMIRGAKLIHENTVKEGDALHINIPPSKIFTSPQVVPEHAKLKSQPKFLNALMTEVGPNKKPKFLHALVAEEKYEESPDASRQQHDVTTEHALIDGPSISSPASLLRKHGEHDHNFRQPVFDANMLNQISGYLATNQKGFLSATNPLMTSSKQTHHEMEFVHPLIDSKGENHRTEFVNPLIVNRKNDHANTAHYTNPFSLSTTHHKPQSMPTDNPFLKQEPNGENLYHPHPNGDLTSAKQTLYDITKSLVKNSNLGGTMVYIPKVASVSKEHADIGTHAYPTGSSSNADHSTEQINRLIENSGRTSYPTAQNENANPTLSDLSNTASSTDTPYNTGMSSRGLDNSHIVNEINEELKAFHYDNYEKENTKSDGGIPLLGKSTQFMSSNRFGQLQYQAGPQRGTQYNNYFRGGGFATNPFRQQPLTADSRQLSQPELYGTQYGSGGASNFMNSIRQSQQTQTAQNTPSFNPFQLPSNNTSTQQPYSKIRILCIGDSLTSGFYGDRHVYHPFSIMLEFLLNNNIADEFQLITKGVGGEKVHQMYERLQKYLVSEKPLDLVIILGGLNDLIKLDINVDIFKRIVLLHELCHTYGVSTVSLTIPETHMPLSRQVYANYDQFLVVWGSLNERIRSYHSNWTIPCDLARNFPLASLNDAEKHAWWSEDFIHPTIEGYNQIGRIIYGCIVSIL